MQFIIDELNPKEKTMTQNAQPNSRTRRLLERGYVMPMGVPTSWTQMDLARNIRHKSLHQLKQEAKAAADHGISR